MSCERILRSLPRWFGIEESLVAYVKALTSLETLVAEVSGEVVGFLALERRSEAAAEIHMMAVAPRHHGVGVGRAVVERAEGILRSRDTEYLQVKTLGPSRPDEAYARTRGFYAHLGFRPLEENSLWGSVNPCLILVKHLRCGG
jgi:GNAT superfamily N-acetyltransferase